MIYSRNIISSLSLKAHILVGANVSNLAICNIYVDFHSFFPLHYKQMDLGRMIQALTQIHKSSDGCQQYNYKHCTCSEK